MCCCFALLAQLSLANGYFTYSGHSHVLLGTSWYVCVLLGSTCGLQLIMCSWYAVLYNLSSNFHLQVGTQQCFGYSPVLLGTSWYVWVLLGTSKYLRVAMNHMVLLHSSRPTFPCTAPQASRETNELPFFGCSSNSLIVERFLFISSFAIFHPKHLRQNCWGSIPGTLSWDSVSRHTS